MNEKISIGTVIAGPGEKVSGYLSIGYKPASEYSIPLTIINGINDGPILTIISGQHGTEYVGICAAIEIIQRVDPKKLSGAILVLPVVNAAGFEQRSRLAFPIEDEFSGTRNINRIWPGDQNGSLAHVTIHMVFNKVVKRGQYLFDIHGGDIYESITSCVLVPKIGSEVDPAVLGIAEAIGFDTIIEVQNARGYSITEAGLAGITSFAVSAGDSGRLEEKFVEELVAGLMNSLRHLKMIEGAVELRKNYRLGYEVVKIKSRTGGLFYQRVPVGTIVQKGQKIGEIISMDGRILESVHAVESGLLFESFCNPAVNTGETLGEIALLRS
jgi:predicted deacylase